MEDLIKEIQEYQPKASASIINMWIRELDAKTKYETSGKIKCTKECYKLYLKAMCDFFFGNMIEYQINKALFGEEYRKLWLGEGIL